ncbi:unnamed protein product [Ixodes pacificus]
MRGEKTWGKCSDVSQNSACACKKGEDLGSSPLPLGAPPPALDQPLSFPAWTRRDTPSLPFGCLPPKLSSVALTSDMHMFCEHPQERKGTNLDNSSGKATKEHAKKNAEKPTCAPS